MPRVLGGLALAALVVALGPVPRVPMVLAQSPGATPGDLPRARLHHIHLNSVNPDASIAFYTSHFKSTAGTFAGEKALSVNGMWFLFNKVASAPPSDPISGFWHIGWGSPDVKATYEQFLKMGTSFETPITNAGEFFGGKRGPLDFMYAEGPGKELIEIYTTDNVDFHHVHLICADGNATQAWYLKYFGTPNGTPRRGPTGIWVGDLNLITAKSDAPIVPAVAKGKTMFESPRGRVLDHFAFEVQSLDQTLARLKADGVAILQEPRVILNGTLRSAFVQAPDNVQLELVEAIRR